jgi:hypothetical protein
MAPVKSAKRQSANANYVSQAVLRQCCQPTSTVSIHVPASCHQLSTHAMLCCAPRLHAGLAIREFWGVDDTSIVFVADPTFGDILNFNVGQAVDLEVPQVGMMTAAPSHLQ